MRFVFILSFCIYGLTAYSQKFGHINSAEILGKVPEIAVADSMLKKFQDTLMITGDFLIKKFQKQVADYQAETQRGSLAPVAAQKKEEELAKEQESLKAFENEVKLKLMQRREQLYRPILDKIDDIVVKIGKDNKYTMIFDSSQPGYLYLTASENLGPLVLKELGMQ